ncbi:MAG: hypothetical protein ACK5ML_01120 [Lachnospiraceae bacterium]
MDDLEEKRRNDEYKKNQMANFSDSVNRSKIGDFHNISKGSCLTKLITLIVIAVLAFLLLK